jgi:hypothetical protein
MTTAAQAFYGLSSLGTYTRKDVLAGRIIKINPALVVLTDGLKVLEGQKVLVGAVASA